MTKLAVIALDGPSGVGKSTTAKRLAQALGWSYLDTGGMYRTAALALKRAGLAPEDPAAASFLAQRRIQQTGTAFFLDGEDVSGAIRTPELSTLTSAVATHPAIRDVLVAQQRSIGAEGGWVVDGRDIGSVVFPDACCKVFLTASAEARAQRRCLELQAAGRDARFEDILEDQRARDLQDSTRAVAPLRKAEGAVEVDSSHLSLEEVVTRILALHRAHATA
ncbi:MAG: Cytidylate kinase [Acidobacteria bacterium ADurb.Bin340]|nr:MAG: Cytidylate kinase [Acidobacteria bacterium ADurb.Bin340]